MIADTVQLLDIILPFIRTDDDRCLWPHPPRLLECVVGTAGLGGPPWWKTSEKSGRSWWTLGGKSSQLTKINLWSRVKVPWTLAPPPIDRRKWRLPEREATSRTEEPWELGLICVFGLANSAGCNGDPHRLCQPPRFAGQNCNYSSVCLASYTCVPVPSLFD